LKKLLNTTHIINSTMIFLKVDVRERDLISLIQAKSTNNKDITVSTETLPLGDVILCNEEKDLLIIERKSIKDLVSSIKDGRYTEQSYRLDGYPIHNHNIVYLIEGDIHKTLFNNAASKQMIYSSLFSLNYCKGFSVIRTFSLEETATFLWNMAEYLGNPTKKGAYYSSSMKEIISDEETGESIPQNYASVVKSVKKENIRPDNIGEIMLSQIPGVSSTSAIAIMKHFKYIVNLIAELQEVGSECLKEVTYLNVKGDSKKLNKTCIANVAKYLLGEE